MQLQETLFSSYTFTQSEEEQLDRLLSSPLLRAYIMSRRADVAIEKATDKMDPAHPMEYMQQESFKAGMLNAFDQLLSFSYVGEDAEAEEGETEETQIAGEISGL